LIPFIIFPALAEIEKPLAIVVVGGLNRPLKIDSANGL
jgi:hypothetical protein